MRRSGEAEDMYANACSAMSLSLQDRMGCEDCRALPIVAAGSLATPLIADDVGEKAMEGSVMLRLIDLMND